MVSQRCIEVNLEKLVVIEVMKRLTLHKEVQILNGRLTTLICFLARVGDKSLPFFQVLRANRKCKWTPECEKAFQYLKQHLRTLPPLAKSSKDDVLSLYLSISLVPVSSVLVKEVGKGQDTVYYVSKIFAKA